MHRQISFLPTRSKEAGSITSARSTTLIEEDWNFTHRGTQIELFLRGKLAIHLCTRYNQLGVISPRPGRSYCPRPRSIGSLATEPLHPQPMCLFYFLDRCKKPEVMTDLDTVIVVAREALELYPLRHPSCFVLSGNLAGSLFTRYLEVLNNGPGGTTGIQSLLRACAYATKARVHAAKDLPHSTILLAYETPLRMLVQHSATLSSLQQHLAVLEKLTSSLAMEALSACLHERAVKLLGRGRGVFWVRLTPLHSPLEDVIASSQARKIWQANSRS